MSEQTDETNHRVSSKWWRPVALICSIAAAIVLSRVLGVADHIGPIRDWIHGLGPWGLVVFIAIYVLATVAALPGTPLTLAAGALFGSVLGVVAVSIASTAGAACAFLISRYFARDAVAKWLTGRETFQKLDRMTEKRGAVIIALTRLVPLFPFNLINYGFGLTRVRFTTYIFWSWLCMLPGTVLYVVGADAVFKGTAEGRVPWALVGVVAAAMIVLTLIVRSARRRLEPNAEDQVQ